MWCGVDNRAYERPYTKNSVYTDFLQLGNLEVYGIESLSYCFLQSTFELLRLSIVSGIMRHSSSVTYIFVVKLLSSSDMDEDSRLV